MEEDVREISEVDAAERAVAVKAKKLNICIDEATGNVSVLDALRTLDGSFAGRKATAAWKRLKERYSDLRNGTTIMKLNGEGWPTATAPPLLLCEIAYLALKDRLDNRREALVKLMKVLSVDVAWIPKWETKYSSDSSSGKKQTHTHEAAVDSQGEESVEGQNESSNDSPLLGLDVSIVDKLEKADIQPTSTSSDGKRKAAVLESDHQGGSSTGRKRGRPRISRNIKVPLLPEPPTKRHMAVRASTAICTKASVNAQGGSGAYLEFDTTPVPVVSKDSKGRSGSSATTCIESGGKKSKEKERDTVASNQNSDSRRSKGKGKDRHTVGSDMPIDIDSHSNIGKGGANSNEGGGSSMDRGVDSTVDSQRGSHKGSKETASVSEGASLSDNIGADKVASDSNEGGGSSTSNVRGDETAIERQRGSHSSQTDSTVDNHGCSTSADSGVGGDSSMNVVQGSETGAAKSRTSAKVQTRIEEVEASAALLPSIMAQLEEVAKSGMSDHAKKLLEAAIVAKLT